MKKRILLFTTAAVIAFVSLMSYNNGAGAAGGYNCTGAETGLSNPAGCSAAGSSCHSTAATSDINVSLELDSAGVAITHYIPGVTYTIKIKGTNNTANSLPKFGFQVTSIKGTTALTTPDSAGKFATTGLPANVRYTPPHPSGPADFVCPLIEHSNPITATSGTGGTGTTYVESFQWTAPALGTGSISIWGALNAVNGNGSADAGDHWNTTNLVLAERDTVVVSHVGVANVTNNNSITAFPNPVNNALNLQIDNAQTGTYSIKAFDITGRCVTNENVELNSNYITINTSNWAPGLYQVMIQNNGNCKIVRVVKNL